MIINRAPDLLPPGLYRPAYSDDVGRADPLPPRHRLGDYPKRHRFLEASVRVEHALAVQKCHFGLILRTVGMVHARVKIDMAL